MDTAVANSAGPPRPTAETLPYHFQSQSRFDLLKQRPVVQFQLVQRAAAIKEAGVAAEDSNADENVVLIEHHAEVGDRTVDIAAGYWIRCTESVENPEVTIRPDTVNDTVTVLPPREAVEYSFPSCPRVSRADGFAPSRF